MKATQVDQALHQKFMVDGDRIVFWHDPNTEFAEYVAGGLTEGLSEVKVLQVADVGGLSAKLTLEREDTSGKYLVYSKGEQPAAEEDWLLDVRLYSSEFHADVASLWLQELELSSLYLREHLKARAAFLGSQDRRRKLMRHLESDDTESLIDLKMIAVIAGADVPNLFAVLRSLCHGHVVDGHFDLDAAPQALVTLEKMGLLEPFWQLVRTEFGYANEAPSLAALLRHLYVSELSHEIGDAKLRGLAQFELSPAGRQNAVVFLAQWRDSSAKATSYDATAEAIAKELSIGESLPDLSLEALAQVFTFWEAEPRVLSRLKDRVLETAETPNVEAVAGLATERRTGHWLAGPDSERPERRAVADAYAAVVAAAELFALRTSHQHGLNFDSPEELLAAYQSELYQFDQLYRRFHANAKAAEAQSWDLLKTLAEEVEGAYDQGFMRPLGLAWGDLLDAGFLDRWELSGLNSQQTFYEKHVARHLKASERNRAYVIISDAFRYEAAQELAEALSSKYRIQAELGAMLGVLPSYTALGMASLLPHERLEYSDKGDVLVDGKPIAGTEARGKQLAKFQGMAVQAKDLRGMKQDDARELTEGKRVVYIYHNVIDARGDTASTESETFSAVGECITELLDLVNFCTNKLNAGTVWITADHGFLFQEKAPVATQKSELSCKPEGALKSKKRYIIGRKLDDAPEVHHGACKVTAGTAGDAEFWVPRGSNRFHFTGGARFVHGGAMPQEVVVPLIVAKMVRGKRQEASRAEKVSVTVLGNKHKITTSKHRFFILQTEPVGDRRKPITLRAAIYDGDQMVTSVETVTFDSESDSLEERKKDVRLHLTAGEFDKSKPYELILRDADTDIKVLSLPVVIDRTLTDDF